MLIDREFVRCCAAHSHICIRQLDHDLSPGFAVWQDSAGLTLVARRNRHIT